jgi:hypothetical protein
LLLSEKVLVLEGSYWDVVYMRPKYWCSSFLEKAIALNRFRRFEYEYREAEYEESELSPTKTPEQPGILKNA